MAQILPEPLKKAWTAFQTGDLAGAEGLCQDILAKHNRNDALYFDAVYLLAAVQLRFGRLAEALANYDEALAIRPRYPEALNNRAVTLKALKRFDEALAGYDSAIAARPDFVEAHNNRGNLLMAMNRFEEALASYDRALAGRPDYAMALSNRGSALNALKRFDEAVISYDKALAIKPDFAEALTNRGVAIEALRRREEALASRKQSLSSPPGNAEILTAQRVILPERGLFEHIAATDEACATQRDPAEVLYHRACALFERRHFEDALASCEEALANRPDFAEALNQRGLIQQELRHLPEALWSFRKAQKVRPDFVDAHRNELQLYLLAGDFRKAWWKCDQLTKRDPSAAPSRKFAKPAWDGFELLWNKTILVHGDGVHDDTIQFCRYVPLLARRGAHVIVEVAKPLRDLVASVAGVAQVATNDDAPAVFDFHCPFFGLPRAFATTLSTIPATTPYLWPPTQMAAKWERLLAAKKRPWIGIIWSDDAPHVKDRSSIELTTFLKLLDVDATFVCAQRDMSGSDAAHLKARPEILTFGEALNDFSEAAGLLSCLDLLISVDSAMAHLAGALGIPVWVLLQYTPDWRWLIDREDSPWYPTVRLFRQRRHDDWNEVVARVAIELQRFVGRRAQKATPAA